MSTSKDSYLIWGSAGHALVLADLLFLREKKIIVLFDNNTNASSVIEGVPIFHGTQALESWVKTKHDSNTLHAAVAIGGSRGKDRQHISNLLRQLDFKLSPLIHPSAYVAPSAHVADGCQLLANSMIGSGVNLMRDCIVNSSANIDHECSLSPGVHVAPGAILCGCISIGENTLIGAGACVLPRIKIGSNCMIGAGAVVVHDIPDFAVAVGNPARIIKYTNDRKKLEI